MNEHALKDETKAFDDIKTFTRKFTKPRHTRAEKTLGHFSCPCSVCSRKPQKPLFYSTLIENKEHFANTQGKKKNFTWLLRELGKASQNMLIKVNIPETVVFYKSKASFLLYQHSDRTLKITSSPQNLRLAELKKTLTQASKHHKREEGPENHNSHQNYGKEVALIRYLAQSQDNEGTFLSQACENGPLRVMQEVEFSELMHERPGSSVWKKISYIQTVVKCKGGIGETHISRYYKHDDQDKKGVFEVQQAGQDDSEGFEMGFMNDINKYSDFVCKRIAYVLLAYAKKDLLRMDAEFLVDDNGKMWLTYASRIAVRDIVGEEGCEKVLFKRVQLRSSETKERLDKEMCWSEEETTGPNQLRMLSVMKKHYVDLKKRIGIEDLIREKPKDSLSSLAFSQLHPYTQYTLHDLIDPESSNKAFKDPKVKRSAKTQNPRRTNSRIHIENHTKSLSKRKIHTNSCRALSQHKPRSCENLKPWLTPNKTPSYAIYYI